VPGVNHLQTYGRWAFVELKDLYKIQSDFSAKIGEEFETIMSGIVSAQPVGVK
jgi:type III restriction enzyme